MGPFQEIQVLEADFEDLPAMVELLGELFSQEADFAPNPDKQRRGLSMILEQPLLGTLFVVKAGPNVIGMASILKSVSTFAGAQVGILEDVILRQEYRGKGIGQQLLSYLIAWANRAGLARLSLLTDADNDIGQAFHQCG
jgi:GNAT superfamily N-acetyltransferase